MWDALEYGDLVVGAVLPYPITGIEVGIESLGIVNSRGAQYESNREEKEGEDKPSTAHHHGTTCHFDLREVIGKLEETEDAEQAQHSEDNKRREVR